MRYPAPDPRRSPAELLEAVIAAYLEAADAHAAPPREELLARYPELAADLGEFFAGHQAIDRLAGAVKAEPRRSPLAGRPAIGAHDLLAEIGRGGMGVVYQARDRKLGRTVALKAILAGALAGEEERQRFLREARAVAALDHPHIVPIHEVGEEDGVPYFTMKLVEGGSLAAWDPLGGRTPLRCAEVMSKVARGVEHAHERGILHRDLKPANVLLDSAGAPYVADFGLARPLELDSSLTASGALVGTASYMAPEQAAGARAAATRSVDVYSLGAILYELLCGAPPFRGATAVETVRQAAEEEPRRPSLLNHSLPRDLETICLKCLEKNPARRYATAADLAEELDRFVAGEPITARPVSAVERSWRWCRRHPVPAVAGLLLGLLALVSTASAIQLARERAQTRESQAAASHARARAAFQMSGRPGQRLQGLEAIREAARFRPSLELRNAAIACLARADLSLRARAASGDPDVSTVALDSGLARYAAGDMRGEVRVRAVDGNRELARFPGEGARAQFLAFGPGDRLLLRVTPNANGHRDLSVWRWETAGPPLLAIRGELSCEEPGFDPGGDRLAFSTADGSLRIAAVASGGKERSFPGAHHARWVRFDPAGRRLALGSLAEQRILVLDAESGERVFAESVPSGTSFVAIEPWHPSGDLVASLRDGNHAVEFWSVSEGKRRERIEGYDNSVVHVAFHPTAELAALASWDLTFRVWTIDGRELVRHDADVIASRFSAGGEAVGCVHTDRSVSVWDLHPSREFRTLRVAAAGEPVGPVACDRSGKVLLAGTRTGVVVIDMRTGKVAATLPLKCLPVPRASPEGPWIVEEGPGWARPWRLTPAAGEVLRVGPPGPKVPLEGAHVHFIQASADGRRLVNQGRPGRVALIEMTGPQMRGLELEHVNAGKVAISPDGRWAASGPVHGRAAVVWDFDSAEVVLRQPGRSETMTAAPVFSPDGRWLLISMGEEIVLYQVPVWTAPRWRIPRPEPIQISTPAAFSGDGELLAAGVHWRTIRLIRAGTGEELATLEAPGHDFVNAIDVSHDGRWIAAGTVAGEVHFWDLARIRPALRDLNLDWDGPPRLEPAEGPGVAPVRVEIAAEEPEAGTPARR